MSERYKADKSRYAQMTYRRSGKSGLKLPLLSFGLWQNFGGVNPYEQSREIVCRAFDSGITHFDLANNYGPPPGSAEETFGKILDKDLSAYRDELVISTKAGYEMWPGPYGNFGSRKYLLASLDQSLSRMGLDYVDIFYHHRPDPDTPMKETMGALDQAVRSGKALYAGVSSYSAEQTRRAAELLISMGTPFVIHQPKYNMLERDAEYNLKEALIEEGLGCIVFSPLEKGLLTDKYLNGIPEGSRMTKSHGELDQSELTEERLNRIRRLNNFAKERGQSLAQLAIAWTLREEWVTSCIIGVSRIEQLTDNLKTLDKLSFTDHEIQAIDEILNG